METPGTEWTEEQKEKFIKMHQDMADKMQKEHDDEHLKPLDDKLSKIDQELFKRLGLKSQNKTSYTTEEIKEVFRIVNTLDNTNTPDTSCGSCRQNMFNRMKQLYNFYK